MPLVNTVILVALIVAALYFDLTKKRIPNFLTFPAILWGLVSHTAAGGLSGFWFSFTGLLVGLAIFFIPFAMGGMGAGDVKLLGAVGALQGWQFVLSAALLTALAGGVMALVYLIATGRLLRVLKKGAGFLLAPFFSFLYYRIRLDFFNRASIFFATHPPEEKEPARMPYGLAIAVGVFVFLAMNLFSWGEQYLSSLPW
jgi:prepilin peptidase CpaA